MAHHSKHTKPQALSLAHAHTHSLYSLIPPVVTDSLGETTQGNGGRGNHKRSRLRSQVIPFNVSPDSNNQRQTHQLVGPHVTFDFDNKPATQPRLPPNSNEAVIINTRGSGQRLAAGSKLWDKHAALQCQPPEEGK